MPLDLNTLLYACAAGALLASGVLSLFGATQSTHPGFRWWAAAQWMLTCGLLLQALIGGHPLVDALVALLILQWPIVVLSGMRRLRCGAARDSGDRRLRPARTRQRLRPRGLGRRRRCGPAHRRVRAGDVRGPRLRGGDDEPPRRLRAQRGAEGAGRDRRRDRRRRGLCGAVVGLESIGPRGQAAVQFATHAILVVAVLGLVRSPLR
jgi:hypothetical protein